MSPKKKNQHSADFCYTCVGIKRDKKNSTLNIIQFEASVLPVSEKNSSRFLLFIYDCNLYAIMGEAYNLLTGNAHGKLVYAIGSTPQPS